ncbi:C-terminal binding protein [Arthrobacter psychrolactophilus]|uniref:C-terminal binding protein n=1 Tax=Arthrobacter psychrolactophilus TaxID=92442 RepID=A0A2V5ISZ9_9MICC|nr:C-terminal binding protein [Arthrobacter psychrolactophilus]PYI39131.1 C-terminal binding protein [Arthrobacter psychrolactophilus]
MAKIIITDCDHSSIAIEQSLAAERGIELVLASCKTEDDVIAAAADADAIIVQYAPVTDRVLAALPGLKAIGRYGVGVDTLDVEAATARGVAVCNVPDYGTEDVSDHAIALALALSRGLGQLDRGLRRGDATLTPAQPLHRFSTRTFGVVGLGLIGAATARKAGALGFDLIGFDPTLKTGTVTKEGVRVVGLEEVLRQADVVSLHVPLNKATHHLIDSETLGFFKSTAVLVNTCRGGVVDTTALVTALSTGALKGAGLDVLEQEPLDVASDLAALDNVILTPHAGWYSEESYSELKYRTLENVSDIVRGVRPRNIMNPTVLDSLLSQGIA